MGTPVSSRLQAAVAGVASLVLGVGLGELTSALVAPESSPFSVVGGWLIDLAPPAAKDAAIALFGTSDKIALLTAIAIVLVVIAVVAGLLQSRRPPIGVMVAGAFGVVGVALAVTRPDAGTLAWLPSTLAGAAAALGMAMLVPQRVRAPAEDATGPTETAPEPVSILGGEVFNRRRFVAWTSAAGIVGVFAVIGGGALRASRGAATVVRSALRLPAPATTAPPVPAAAELGLPGLTPVVTPTADFYRIDTALAVPRLDPGTWSLRIHGMVEQEVTLTWDDLLALPLEESYTTLMCVSNSVGGDLIGNALWLGYPIRHLLEHAGPTAGADMVLSTSSDGFTASTPLEVLTDDRNAILAVGMNGEPLTAEHGYPVRMVVPGLYGYVSATKWVVALEVTRFDHAQGYWTPRGWAAKAPIKVQSRIDVPARGSTVEAGSTVIAGVAWQQHVGISAVEVQVDDGPWQQATLATAISDDTWVQWSLPWDAETGRHTMRCRATNADGETQTQYVALPAPDGATGWHEIELSVS